MLITCKYQTEINQAKAQLRSNKKNPWYEIIQDQKARRLCISQKSYIEKVLERFGMHNTKAVSTPFATHFKLFAKISQQTAKEEEFMS